MSVQAGEKTAQNYRLEVTNPGGHSARPVRNNAIYQLAAGLEKISAYEFPSQSTDISRDYFAKMASQVGGEMGAAMTAFAKNPNDAAAIAAAGQPIPAITAMLHTTCVATMLEPATPPTPCPSAPAPISIAASFPASRRNRCARSWPNWRAIPTSR